MSILTRAELFEQERLKCDKCEKDKVSNLTNYIHEFLKKLNGEHTYYHEIPIMDSKFTFNNCKYSIDDEEVINILEKETQKYGYNIYEGNYLIYLAISNYKISLVNNRIKERNLEKCENYFKQFKISPKLDNEFKQISYDSSICNIEPFISTMKKNFPNYNFTGKIINKDLFELFLIKK